MLLNKNQNIRITLYKRTKNVYSAASSTLASISDVRIALESFGAVAPCPPDIASSNAVFNHGAIQAYASDSSDAIGVIRAEEHVRIMAHILQRPLQHRRNRPRIDGSLWLAGVVQLQDGRVSDEPLLFGDEQRSQARGRGRAGGTLDGQFTEPDSVRQLQGGCGDGRLAAANPGARGVAQQFESVVCAQRRADTDVVALAAPRSGVVVAAMDDEGGEEVAAHGHEPVVRGGHEEAPRRVHHARGPRAVEPYGARVPRDRERDAQHLGVDPHRAIGEGDADDLHAAVAHEEPRRPARRLVACEVESLAEAAVAGAERVGDGYVAARLRAAGQRHWSCCRHCCCHCEQQEH